MPLPDLNSYLRDDEDRQFTLLYDSGLAELALSQDERYGRHSSKAPYLNAEILLRQALAHLAGSGLDSFKELSPHPPEAIAAVAEALRGKAPLPPQPEWSADLEFNYLRARIREFINADGSFPVVDPETGESRLIPFKLLDAADSGAGGGSAIRLGDEVRKITDGSCQWIAVFGSTQDIIEGRSYELAVLLAWIAKASWLQTTIPGWMLCGTGVIDWDCVGGDRLAQKRIAAGQCQHGIFVFPADSSGAADSAPWCHAIPAATDGSGWEPLALAIEGALIERKLLSWRGKAGDALSFAADELLPITASLVDDGNVADDDNPLPDEFSVGQIPSLFEHCRLVILSGDSGSGKSTLLRSIEAELRERPFFRRGRSCRPLVPLFIPGDRLSGGSEPLVGRIKRDLKLALTPYLGERLLLIIDGLDPTATPDPGDPFDENKFREIIDLLDRYKVRCLISCRDAAPVKDCLNRWSTIQLQMDLLDERIVADQLRQSPLAAGLLQTLQSLSCYPFYYHVLREIGRGEDTTIELAGGSSYHLMDWYLSPRTKLRQAKDREARELLARAAVDAVAADFSMRLERPPGVDVMLYAGAADSVSSKHAGRRVLVPRETREGGESIEFIHSLFRDFLWVYYHVQQDGGAAGAGAEGRTLEQAIRNEVLDKLQRILDTVGTKDGEGSGKAETARKVLDPWRDILLFAVGARPELLQHLIPVLKRTDLLYSVKMLKAVGHGEGKCAAECELSEFCQELVYSNSQSAVRRLALRALAELGEKEILMGMVEGSRGLYLQAVSERKQIIRDAIEHGQWDLAYFMVKQSILGRARSGVLDDAAFAVSGQGVAEALFRHLLTLCYLKNRAIQSGYQKPDVARLDGWERRFGRWLGTVNAPRQRQRVAKLDHNLQASIPLVATLLADDQHCWSNRLTASNVGWEHLCGLLPHSFWTAVLNALMQFKPEQRPSLDLHPMKPLIADALDAAGTSPSATALIRACYLYQVSAINAPRPDVLWKSVYHSKAIQAGLQGRDQAWILAAAPTVWRPDMQGLKSLFVLIRACMPMSPSLQEATLLGNAAKMARRDDYRREMARWFIKRIGYAFRKLHPGKFPGYAVIWIMISGSDEGIAVNPTGSWPSLEECIERISRFAVPTSGKDEANLFSLMRTISSFLSLIQTDRVKREEGAFAQIAARIGEVSLEIQKRVSSLLEEWPELTWPADAEPDRVRCLSFIGKSALKLGKVLLAVGHDEQAAALRSTLMKCGGNDFADYSRAMLEDAMVQASRQEGAEESGLSQESLANFSPRMRIGLWGRVFLKEQAGKGRRIRLRERFAYIDSVYDEYRSCISESDLQTECLLFEIALRKDDRGLLLEIFGNHTGRDCEAGTSAWAEGVRFSWGILKRLRPGQDAEWTAMLLASPAIPDEREAVWNLIRAVSKLPLLDLFCEPLLGLFAAKSGEAAGELAAWFTDQALDLGPDEGAFGDRGQAIAVLKAIFELLIVPLGGRAAGEWLAALRPRLQEPFRIRVMAESAAICIKVARTCRSAEEFGAWVQLARESIRSEAGEDAHEGGTGGELFGLKARIEAASEWRHQDALAIPANLEAAKQASGLLGYRETARHALQLEESISDGILIHLAKSNSNRRLSAEDFSSILDWTRHARFKVFRTLAREIVAHFEPSDATRDLLGKLLCYLPTHVHSSIVILAANLALASAGDEKGFSDLLALLNNSPEVVEDLGEDEGG